MKKLIQCSTSSKNTLLKQKQNLRFESSRDKLQDLENPKI